MNVKLVLLKYWVLPAFVIGVPLAMILKDHDLAAFNIAGVLGAIVGFVWFACTRA